MRRSVFEFLRRKPQEHPPVDRKVVREAARKYLDSRNYSLYANWDLSRTQRKEMAIEWLTDQVMEVLDQIGGDHGH